MTTQGNAGPALNDLLDGLTADQLTALPHYLFLNKALVTRANIKGWLKKK